MSTKTSIPGRNATPIVMILSILYVLSSISDGYIYSYTNLIFWMSNIVNLSMFIIAIMSFVQFIKGSIQKMQDTEKANEAKHSNGIVLIASHVLSFAVRIYVITVIISAIILSI